MHILQALERVDIDIWLHNFEALLILLSVQPTLIDRIKASQEGDPKLQRIKKKVQSSVAFKFKIHEDGSFRFSNRLCSK